MKNNEYKILTPITGTPVDHTNGQKERDTGSTPKTEKLDKILSNLNIASKYYTQEETEIAPDILTEMIVETRGGNTVLEKFKKQLDNAISSGAVSFGGIVRIIPVRNGITSVLIMIEAGRIEELKMRLSIISGIHVYDYDFYPAKELHPYVLNTDNNNSPIQILSVKRIGVKIDWTDSPSS